MTRSEAGTRSGCRDRRPGFRGSALSFVGHKATTPTARVVSSCCAVGRAAFSGRGTLGPSAHFLTGGSKALGSASAPSCSGSTGAGWATPTRRSYKRGSGPTSTTSPRLAHGRCTSCATRPRYTVPFALSGSGPGGRSFGTSTGWAFNNSTTGYPTRGSRPNSASFPLGPRAFGCGRSLSRTSGRGY